MKILHKKGIKSVMTTGAHFKTLSYLSILLGNIFLLYFSFVHNSAILGIFMLYSFALFTYLLYPLKLSLSIIILLISIPVVPFWFNSYSILKINSLIKINYPVLVLIIILFDIFFTKKIRAVDNYCNKYEKYNKYLLLLLVFVFIYTLFNIFYLSDIEGIRVSYIILFPIIYFILFLIGRNQIKLDKIFTINLFILSTIIEGIVFFIVFLTHDNPFLPPDKLYVIESRWIGFIVHPSGALDPHTGAVFFCEALLLCYYMYVFTQKKKYLIFALFFTASNIIAFSRTGWVILILSIIFIFRLNRRLFSNKFKMRGIVLLFIITSFLIVFFDFIQNKYSDNYFRKIYSQTTQEKYFLQILPAINTFSSSIFNVFFGIGYENWRYYHYNPIKGAPVHQAIIGFLLDFGIIGLSLWILIFFIIIKKISLYGKAVKDIKHLILGKIIKLSIYFYFLLGFLQPYHIYHFQLVTVIIILYILYLNEANNYSAYGSKT